MDRAVDAGEAREPLRLSNAMCLFSSGWAVRGTLIPLGWTQCHIVYRTRAPEEVAQRKEPMGPPLGWDRGRGREL